MKSLLKKVRENKKGFTLAELLVVVAIIGILVAVSIPVFTSQLTKAKQATNLANLRAAKAAAVAEYLSSDQAGDVTYNYNPAEGTVADANGAPDSEAEKSLDINATTNKVDGNNKYNKFSVKIEGAGQNGAAKVTVYGEYKTN